MTTILNVIPEYVLTAVISAAFIFIINGVHNYVHSKALTAKTAQSKELWSFIDQVSETAVNSLVSANKSGDEKFANATAIVQNALTKQGFTNVDVSAIEAAVQAAYEKSPLTPNSGSGAYEFKKPDVATQPGSAAAIDPKEEK